MSIAADDAFACEPVDSLPTGLVSAAQASRAASSVDLFPAGDKAAAPPAHSVAYPVDFFPTGTSVDQCPVDSFPTGAKNDQCKIEFIVKHWDILAEENIGEPQLPLELITAIEWSAGAEAIEIISQREAMMQHI